MRFGVNAIALIIAVTITIFITYWAFLQGWWLPIVPSAIALILAAAAIAIVTQRRLATMQLQETVRQLIVVSRSQLTVQKIALELLKRSENARNRELIAKLTLYKL